MAHPRPLHGLDADTPVSEAAPLVLETRLAEVLDHGERALARTDPEDLHDLRVATRRLRAALQLLGGQLKKRERDVKQLGDALGEVRDCDVLIGWLEHARAAAAPDEEAGIVSILASVRARLPPRENALAHEWRHFTSEVAPAIRVELPRAGFDKPLGGKRVRKRVARRLGRLAGEVERLSSVDDAARVHAVRIQGKKARYQLEVLGLALPDETRHAIDRLKRLQELVGEVHDCDVRLGELPAWVARADRPGQPGAVRLLRDTLDERRRFAGELAAELVPWRDGLARDLADEIRRGN